ncbi:MAG: hypothetical protein ACR2JY_15150 [Chloroflexota bacterium]
MPGAPDTLAVTYNRAAIDSTRTATNASGATASDPQQSQAVAAVRLGWALEELVARARMVQAQLGTAPGLEFPPDLTHQLTPAGQIRALAKLLARQEKLLLSPDAAPANDPLPSAALETAAALKAFPTAAVDGRPTIGLLKQLEALIGQWDELIIEFLLDPDWPSAASSAALVSAYEVGKALSRTRWYIWAEVHAASLPGAPPPAAVIGTATSAAWALMFDGPRIGQIRRQLDSLGDFLGGQTVATVSSSLEYWHNALHNLDRILQAGAPAPLTPQGDGQGSVAAGQGARQRSYASWPRGMAAGSAPAAIRVTGDESPLLLAALEEQMDNWYDLLTGRRPPGAFPITGIITRLLDELGREVLNQAESLGTRLLRGMLLPLAPVVGIILVLVAVVTLILIVLGGPGNADPVARGAAGVGAGLTGLVALVAARGSTLFTQGQTALGDLQQRIARVEGQVQERLAALEAAAPAPVKQVATTVAAAAPSFSWQKVWQNAMADVLDQLKLEELNLAVSEPLVRYVLTPQGDQIGDDPMLAIRRFLELVYDSTSNVERLEAVFTDLYKQTITGTATGQP